MLQKSRIQLIFALFFVFSCSAYAQPSKMQFGEVPKSDLQMTSYDPDPDAAAVILGEYGQLYFDTDLDGFEIVFKHHRRVKILKSDGLDQANISIPLYKGRGGLSKMTSFKAVSLNAEGEKSKIGLKEMFLEDVTETWKNAKFTVPGVEVGTVIDIEYQIQSRDFYTLRRYQFQHEIPAVASEFQVEIPEYFDYKVLLSGYEQMADFSQENESRVFQLIGNRGSMQKLNARVYKYRYLMRDVAAFYPEPYMACVKDNLAAIRFELASYKFPHLPKESIMSTWEELNLYFLDHENLGGQMNRTRFLKTMGEELIAEYPDPEKRLSVAFNRVSKHMEWNKDIRTSCDKSLEASWRNQYGNNAEINLILRGLLEQAGITADPVLISTRDHGKIPKDVPFYRNFNYLIVRAEIGEKAWLMDATDKWRPFNILPNRCLNGEGLLLRREQPGWVNLNNGEQYKTFTTGLVHINPDGSLNGNVRIAYSGLDGAGVRQEVVELGKESYLQSLRESYPDWKIEKIELSGVEDQNEDVGEGITFKEEEAANVHGKLMYLAPLTDFTDNENPFQREERKFPVDIGCSLIQKIVLTFTIPEGYTVEEVPENMQLRLPDNGGHFKYLVSAEGNSIQLVSYVQLTGPLYHSDSYPALREFCDRIIEKQAEQFVLKKGS